MPERGPTSDPDPAEPTIELDPIYRSGPRVREGPARPIESTRATLAYCLFGLLAAIIATMFAMIIADVINVQEFTDLIGVIIAPVIGLLGAATGYYYGRGDR